MTSLEKVRIWAHDAEGRRIQKDVEIPGDYRDERVFMKEIVQIAPQACAELTRDQLADWLEAVADVSIAIRVRNASLRHETEGEA